MKLTTTILATLCLIASSAMAQTFQVSPNNGNGFQVQGSDGSVYDYSVAPNGGYLVQKQGASGEYQASPPSGNGYLIQGVDNPKWTLPVIVPPQQ